MKQILVPIFLFTTLLASAQIDVGGIVKRKAEQRVQQKIEQGVDKAFDETEEGIKESAKGDKDKDKNKDEEGQSDAKNDSKTATEAPAKDSKKSLSTYSKFDFVPGEKVMVEDHFAQVAVGDYPVDWNTNSGGEIVQVDGKDGKWLQITKEGVHLPDYFTDLPDNFTLQWDVIVNEEFSFYSGALDVTFLSTQNRQKLNDFTKYSHPAHALRLGMHPTDAGGGKGTVSIENWDASGARVIDNTVSNSKFHSKTSNFVHVSVWRQKQRLRVYFNDEKVLDIPRAFDGSVKYNAISFGYGGGGNTEDKYLLGNIRLAVGAPDTRSKLVTEGKLVTRGILFDKGSDKIKPESYGTLKDIAGVLTEYADIKVTIIGHTDSDGDDASNLELSKKRAAAVKDALSKEFAIDASRMETDGKGETQPSDKNDTEVGKANNRRVEFVKR
jgi:OOP family OmpA-OmpF porin